MGILCEMCHKNEASIILHSQGQDGESLQYLICSEENCMEEALQNYGIEGGEEIEDSLTQVVVKKENSVPRTIWALNATLSQQDFAGMAYRMHDDLFKILKKFGDNLEKFNESNPQKEDQNSSSNSEGIESGI